MSAGSRVERLGHVMFIVMCLTISAAAVQYVLMSRSAAAPNRKPPVAEGTRLTLPAEATRGGQTPGVLLVLSSQCRFCTESMPFYTRLSKLPDVQSGRLRIAAVTLQPVVEMNTYLATHGLAVSAVIPVASAGFNVMGTPALILVRPDGTVTGSWGGWLNPEEESNVIASIGKLTRG